MMNSAAIAHPGPLQNLDGIKGCLTVGSRVLTPKGEVFAEDLRLGDKVLTKDVGYQILSHFSMFTASMSSQEFGPLIRISQNCLSQDHPSRTSYFLTRQLVALSHPMFEPLFGATEVLACVSDLVHLAGIDATCDATEVTIIELGFQRPQLIFTDGMTVEINPDRQTSCRPVLSSQEVQLASRLLAPRGASNLFAAAALH